MGDFCVVTPLGAAIVEALPDRKLMAEIKRKFRQSGQCPTSKIFPTQESIAAFWPDRKDGER